MKRIQSACLQQTIHFERKEDLGHAEAVETVKKELEGYKTALERKRVPFKIEEESTLSDGSMVLKIKKQYNSYPCGAYLQ